MDNFYEKLAAFKKDKDLSYRELGSFINKTSDAFRVAVKRESLSELEKEKISELFGSEQKPNKLQSPDKIENILGESVYKKIKPVLDELRSDNKMLYEILMNQNLIIEEMKQKIEETLEAVKK